MDTKDGIKMQALFYTNTTKWNWILKNIKF
jgi:hypothetical protein